MKYASKNIFMYECIYRNPKPVVTQARFERVS